MVVRPGGIFDSKFAPDIQPLCRDLVAAGIAADNSFNTYLDIALDEDEKKSWGPYADGRLQYLPLDPGRIATFYMGGRTLPSLQHVLSRRLATVKLDAFLPSSDCTIVDRIRLQSCRSKESGRWLRLHPLTVPLSD